MPWGNRESNDDTGHVNEYGWRDCPRCGKKVSKNAFGFHSHLRSCLKKPLVAKRTRFKCVKCGKITAGRIPRRGDGTVRFPRKHKVDGKPCPGNMVEAEWVDVEHVFPPAPDEARRLERGGRP